MLKGNGILYLVLSAGLGIVLLKRCRVPFAALCTGIFAAWMVVTGPIYTAAGFASSGINDVLTIPSLQVARVVALHGEELSSQQRQFIAEVLPYDELPRRYAQTLMRDTVGNPSGSWDKASQAVGEDNASALYDATLWRVGDYVKNTIDSDAFRQNPLRYGSLWAKLGAQYPGEYAKAFFLQSSGYWFPGSRAPQLSLVPYDLFVQRQDSSFDPQAPAYSPKFSPALTAYPAFAFLVYGLAALPVFGLFFSAGFQFWCAFFCAAQLLYSKNRRQLLLLAPAFAGFLICIFSPVNNLYRYAFPAIITLPFAIGVSLFSGTAHTRVSTQKHPEK